MTSTGALGMELPSAPTALRARLAGFPDPLAEAWLQIQPDELLKTLRLLDRKQVERMLHDLHAPTPRRPSLVSCRAVLRVDERWRPVVATFVTTRIRDDLHGVRLHEHSLDELLTQWPPSMVRLGLLLELGLDGLAGSSAELLIENGLAPTSWSSQQAEILALARAARVEPMDTGEELEEPGAASEHGRDAITGDRMSPDAAVENAQRAFGEARAAWTRVGASLEEGLAPDSGDLQVLESVEARLRVATDALTAAMAGHHADEAPMEPALPALIAAQDRLAALSNPLLLVVRRYEALAGPPDASEHVGRVQELSRDLLAHAGSWSEADKAAAGFLAKLAELIDLAVLRSGGTEQLIELDGAVRGAVPSPDLGAVVVLAAGGHLRLPATPQVPEEPSEAGLASPQEPETQPSAKAQPATDEPVVKATTASRRQTTAESATLPPQRNGGPDDEGTMVAEAKRPAEPTPEPPEPPPSPPAEVSGLPPVEGEHVAEDAAAIEAPPESGAIDEERVATVFGRLLAERRLGLAYWLATVTGEPSGVCRLLEMSAYEQAARSVDGECAIKLRTLAEGAAPGDLLGNNSLRFLGMVAAIRACLVTPHTGVGTLLPEAVDAFEEAPPALAAIAQKASELARRGILLTNDALDPDGTVATTQQELASIAAEASSFLKQGRRLNFQRGSLIWDRWCLPEGPVGSLLTPVEQRQFEHADAIAAQVAKLSSRDVLKKELRSTDRALRGSGSKPIEGSARNRLLDLAHEAVELARRWVHAAERMRRAQSSAGGGRIRNALEDLRSIVDAHRRAARAELITQAEDGNPIARGAAAGALALLDETLGLLEGRPLPGAEPSLPEILGLELLRSNLRLNPSLEPIDSETLGVDAVLSAAGRSWAEAFDLHMATDNHQATGAIVEVLRAEDPEQAERLRQLRDRRLAQVREELSREGQALLNDINWARRQSRLGEDFAIELTNRVEMTRPGSRLDLDVVREELAAARHELESASTAAQDELRRRLAERQKGSPKVHSLGLRIEELVNSGDLATAEEYIRLAETGEDPGSSHPPSEHFEEFFPAVPRRLSSGITVDLVEIARGRGSGYGVSFSRLSTELAEATAEALAAWRKLATGPARHESEWLDALRVILRLGGIELAGVKRTGVLGSLDRIWLELTGVRLTGRPLVSEFGSELRGRLRLLLCWKNPSETTLVEWIEQDPSGRPVAVLHFGTLSPERRQRLAEQCRLRRSRPVIVIDDAVLAFVAAKGERRLDVLLRMTLPFAPVNPYQPDAKVNTPPELFYGREKEQRDIAHPTGTSILFGGRWLGKSALLKATARRFEETPGQRAIYLDLNMVPIAATRRADRVWQALWDKLAEAGIARAGALTKDNDGKVKAAIQTWLADDDSRRLLLLLDECDRFFDADRAVGFANTDKLRGLMDDTERRCKAVFAGLHAVQRFAMVPNQPFAHLGRPTPIGPLQPQAAYDLIETPLQALGYRFRSDDLVNRILAFCNYQPVLLQLCGQALIEHQRTDGKALTPPRWIDSAAVDQVLASKELQDGISRRFNETLALDPRYKVIAHVVAHEAHEHAHSATLLSAAELLHQSREWWPDGFSELRPDAFRLMLDEMVGLGVLTIREGGNRYGLRSSNVLRLLGSSEEVEEQLMQFDDLPPPPESESVVLETRIKLDPSSGARSPLSEQQLADLIGERRNQTRLVLGSEATGIGHVIQALEVTQQRGWFKLVKPTRHSYYRQALREGDPPEHRVIASVLSDVAEGSCAASLDVASRIVPQRGVTRSVVLISDARKLNWWLDLFELGEKLGDGIAIVELRRYTPRTLRVWAVDADSAFQQESARRGLLETTGGWPLLIDRVARLVNEGQTIEVALQSTAHDLAEQSGAQGLVEASGVAADNKLAAAWSALIDLGEGARAPAEELALVLEDHHPRPRAAIEVFRALQALEFDETDSVRPEPLLSAAWRTVTAG